MSVAAERYVVSVYPPTRGNVDVLRRFAHHFHDNPNGEHEAVRPFHMTFERDGKKGKATSPEAVSIENTVAAYRANGAQVRVEREYKSRLSWLPLRGGLRRDDVSREVREKATNTTPAEKSAIAAHPTPSVEEKIISDAVADMVQRTRVSGDKARTSILANMSKVEKLLTPSFMGKITGRLFSVLGVLPRVSYVSRRVGVEDLNYRAATGQGIRFGGIDGLVAGWVEDRGIKNVMKIGFITNLIKRFPIAGGLIADMAEDTVIGEFIHKIAYPKVDLFGEQVEHARTDEVIKFAGFLPKLPIGWGMLISQRLGQYLLWKELSGERVFTRDEYNIKVTAAKLAALREMHDARNTPRS